MKARYNTIIILSLWAVILGGVAWATVFTSTIDTSTPAGSDAPSVIDNRIREAKAGWQERLNVDHAFQTTGTQVSDPNVGEHRRVTFSGPKLPPTVEANTGVLQMTDVSALGELIWYDEGGNALVLSDEGEIPFTSLGQLANNTAFSAIDFAGTGTVDLIKADVNDVAVLVDDSQTETNAAPTFTKSLTNKKYVDDQITSNQDPAYSGGESHTFNGGLILKGGVSSSIAGLGSITITFGAAFPNAIVTGLAAQTEGTCSEPMIVTAITTSSITIKNSCATSQVANWTAWGN